MDYHEYTDGTERGSGLCPVYNIVKSRVGLYNATQYKMSGLVFLPLDSQQKA